MCPVAAESKNSKPSSKKKINKKITNLETVVEEESNINSQSLQKSSDSSESRIETNNEYIMHDGSAISALANIGNFS